MESTKIKVGFALTGSFCTFDKVFEQLDNLVDQGFDVFPIMSETSAVTDTRFGTAASHIERIETATGKSVIATISAAEPIGPKRLFDILIIAPCTGNTLGKLANGITDSAVTMAAKAHMRNRRPLALAVSTNDGLGASACNIGRLLTCRNIFFVPFGQDDWVNKQTSLVADMSLIGDTIREALLGKQLQPILCGARPRGGCSAAGDM